LRGSEFIIGDYMNTRKLLIGILLATLGFLGGAPTIQFAEEKASSESKPESPDVEGLKSVRIEIQDFKGEENPEMDEDTEKSLEGIREFWKREDIPHDSDFYFIPFQVPPRRDELELYPCMDCHEDEEINNPIERVLEEEHEDIKLNHGGNRFWCPTCHLLTNKNFLRSLKSKELSFDRSYLLCGQCHFQRQKDWFSGGHGKRIGNWNGDRIILNCTECHNPHSPSIKPKHPDPPPEHHQAPYNIVVQILEIFR